MPSIVRVRNKTRTELNVGPLGRTVAPDCLADFPGRVLSDEGDHYLIESGNPATVRAWPKATWSLESKMERAEK